jgi:AraC-like DNA-binding protein
LQAQKISTITMIPFDPKIFTLSAPAISALVAMLIILFDVFEQGGNQRRIKLKLAFYLGAMVATTSSAFIYFYFPYLFVWMNGLYMFSFMAMPIFLYAFIFEITTTDRPERFSKLHYVAPTVLALFLTVVSIITPLDEQIMTVKGNGAYNGGSKLFFYASNGKLFLRLVFSAVYLLLSFRRLPRYRSYISSYSANESKSSLRWLTIYLFFLIGTIPIPLIGQFVPRDVLVSSSFGFIHIPLLVFQHSFLAFHAIKGNYILQEQIPMEEPLPAQVEEVTPNQEIPVRKSQLTREVFDCYMMTQRPYLNPDLKITDLVNDLKINRTYISTFINAEYGLNFSSFVNQKRLKEYERLSSLPEMQHKTNSEIAELAGFGSYRNYSRIANNT